MRHSRRITALLAGLLLAHVTWVGTGNTCSMPEMQRGSESMAEMDMSSADMAKMDMSNADMAEMDMSSAMMQPSDSPAHHHESCDLPWVPDDCQSMAPCAPLALASVPQGLEAPVEAPLRVSSRPVLTPPSQVRVPEPPPPRA